MLSHELAYGVKGARQPGAVVDYGRELEHEIAALSQSIEAIPSLANRYSPRWLAIKLLEDDSDIEAKVAAASGGRSVLDAAESSRKHLQGIYGDEADVLVADRRYGYISGLVREAVRRPAFARVTVLV